jgi:hypothetical protein
MANIFDYLQWRCDVPFSADPFNEVDNLVLAELAYTDFKGIVPEDGEAIPLSAACKLFFERHTHEEIAQNKSFTAKAPLLMEKMLEGARFRDAQLCLYIDETDTAQEVQLAAVTILLPGEGAYIAFRGTDGTLVGWKEDFNFSFLSETEGQRRAVQYLNRAGQNCSAPLRIGGHSKGGNLAVYAASFCLEEVQDRILAVYSNDGPGFQGEILQSEGYRRILPRIVRIIPDSSIIGLLLNAASVPRVIKSTQFGIFQHDGFSWSVSRNRFLGEALSSMSQFIEKFLGDWLSQLDEEARRSFIEIVFSVFESTGAERFSEISQQKLKSMEAILTAIRNLPREKQQEVLKVLHTLGQNGGQAVTEYVSSLLKK